jgi:hypothetical protein
MATIQYAREHGWIEIVPLPDWEERQSIRALYATPDFLDRIEEDEALHDPTRSKGGRTLYDHLWQRMADFRCSARPGSGDIHQVMPIEKGVWKVHAPGLRLLGWPPAIHSLVLVEYVLADESHAAGVIAKKREEVLAFIGANELSETMLTGAYLEIFPHQ